TPTPLALPGPSPSATPATAPPSACRSRHGLTQLASKRARPERGGPCCVRGVVIECRRWPTLPPVPDATTGGCAWAISRSVSPGSCYGAGGGSAAEDVVRVPDRR